MNYKELLSRYKKGLLNEEEKNIVEQELEKAAANQLQNNVEYLRREEAFFPLWDSDNCKRNYEAIKEI